MLVQCREDLSSVPADVEGPDAGAWSSKDRVRARVQEVGAGRFVRHFWVSDAEPEERLAEGWLLKLVPFAARVAVADPVCLSSWDRLAGYGLFPVVCFVRQEKAAACAGTGFLVARFDPRGGAAAVPR